MLSPSVFEPLCEAEKKKETGGRQAAESKDQAEPAQVGWRAVLAYASTDLYQDREDHACDEDACPYSKNSACVVAHLSCRHLLIAACIRYTATPVTDT